MSAGPEDPGNSVWVPLESWASCEGRHQHGARIEWILYGGKDKQEVLLVEVSLPPIHTDLGRRMMQDWLFLGYGRKGKEQPKLFNGGQELVCSRGAPSAAHI